MEAAVSMMLQRTLPRKSVRVVVTLHDMQEILRVDAGRDLDANRQSQLGNPSVSHRTHVISQLGTARLLQTANVIYKISSCGIRELIVSRCTAVASMRGFLVKDGNAKAAGCMGTRKRGPEFLQHVVAVDDVWEIHTRG